MLFRSGNPASDRVLMKMILASTDPVAADVACANTLGQEPTRFGYIAKAAALGLGTLDLDSLDMRRLVL